MALFTVNTGCKGGLLLSWEWELAIPQLATSVFFMPGTFVKTATSILVVLNRTAKSVMEAGGSDQSDTRPHGIWEKPITRMLTAPCKRARIRAELTKVCVQDLKHAFGRTLASTGVDLRGSARSAGASLRGSQRITRLPSCCKRASVFHSVSLSQ